MSMTDRHGNPTVKLANGRIVTRGTSWWIGKLSGSRNVKAGATLCCIHNVSLAKPCEECRK